MAGVISVYAILKNTMTKEQNKILQNNLAVPSRLFFLVY